MCIYRCEIRKMSRSNGQSAVASAAYRAGEKLTDQNDWQTKAAKTHDYTCRAGVLTSGLILPDNAPDHFNNRAALWNAAERAERKGNSLVARECVIALPHELTDKQRLAVTVAFAAYLSNRYGVACDYAVHRPDKGGDHRNHHAHIMFTTRSLTQDGMGAKTRVLDDKKTGAAEFKTIRKAWETLCNDALAKAEINARVDCRSLKDQGIDRLPEPKQGPIATQMEREGRPSHAGEERRATKEFNQVLQTEVPDEDEETDGNPGRKYHVMQAVEQCRRERNSGKGIAALLRRYALMLLQASRRRREAERERLRKLWLQTMQNTQKMIQAAKLRQNQKRSRMAASFACAYTGVPPPAPRASQRPENGRQHDTNLARLVDLLKGHDLD